MCLTPYTVEHKLKGRVPVPCGKCPVCLKRRATGWAQRLQQVEKICMSSQFITLTYNTKYVPINDKLQMVLDKTDLQRFIKRLRRYDEMYYDSEGIVDYPKIKYYACGEYGGSRFRPHYHMLLFNARLESIDKAWYYFNADGERIESLGHIHYGTVEERSVAYCLKYMQKPPRIKDDRPREFSLMSKGLGVSYLTPNMQSWHKALLEERMYVPLKGGKKIAMPRYYKDKLYTEQERDRIAFFSAIKANKALEEAEKAGVEKYGYDLWQKMKVDRDKHAFDKMYKDALKDRDKKF